MKISAMIEVPRQPIADRDDVPLKISDLKATGIASQEQRIAALEATMASMKGDVKNIADKVGVTIDEVIK